MCSRHDMSKFYFHMIKLLIGFQGIIFFRFLPTMIKFLNLIAVGITFEEMTLSIIKGDKSINEESSIDSKLMNLLNTSIDWALSLAMWSLGWFYKFHISELHYSCSPFISQSKIGKCQGGSKFTLTLQGYKSCILTSKRG